jgi:[protein-PII] uridylyltransferase
LSAYLQREFAVLDARLERRAGSPPEELQSAYQHFLRAAGSRLRRDHEEGGSGRLVAKGRGQMQDMFLRHLWSRAVESNHGEKLPVSTLIALGGYGRGELNPFSDVDVMFLHAPTSQEEEKRLHKGVEGILYVLWDLGFKVGHSTRNIAQAITAGNEDLQTKTSMIECRRIAGDTELFEDFQKQFEKRCIVGQEKEYVQWRVADQSSRHEKHGGSVFLQEPHIKEGCGGLRDYHNLCWLGYVWKRARRISDLAEEGILARSEARELERAFDFIMRVRTALHHVSERANDQLALSIQLKVATNLGYEERPPVRRVESFMRDYYMAARDIWFYTNAATRRIADSSLAKRRSLFPRLFRPKSEAAVALEGFVLRHGEIGFENKNVFNEDPLRLVRVFQLCQQHHATLTHDLQRLIRRRLDLLERSMLYSVACRELVLAILSHKGEVARVLRLMHETGVLGRVFPEFAPLTCLVQHEFFHRYSADEHTLVCLEQLDALVSSEPVPRLERYQLLLRNIERPAILFLAMLLHDTGKAESKGDHAELSALHSVRVARRLKLSPEDLRTLAFLADHHLTLSHTAQRRNIDDMETIHEFARVVETQHRLDKLMLVTFADGRGTTGGEGWSDWKEALVWQLYERTKLVLAQGPEFVRLAGERNAAVRQRILEAVPRAISEEDVNTHLDNLPQRYLLACSESDILRHIKTIYQFLKQQMDPATNPLLPVLAWEHYPDRGHSELLVVTWDRKELFARIAGSISAAGLNILSADIFTRTDNIALDTFRIATDRGAFISDQRDIALVGRTLNRSLTENDFDIEEILAKLRSQKKNRDPWHGQGFPTTLVIDSTSLPNYTLVEVQTPDRPGLLHDLVVAITAEGAQIMFSRIETEKGAAIDTFYIANAKGKKITDDQALTSLKTRVLGITDGYAPEPPKKAAKV